MTPGTGGTGTTGRDAEPEAPAHPSVWQRTPLWLRLITALLALTALALTVTGVFGARLLRSYLVGRVDEQLAAAMATVFAAVDPFDVGSQVHDQPGEGDLQLPSEFRLALKDADGETVGQRVSPLREDEAPPALPDLTPHEVSGAGELITVSAVRGNASWRVLVRPLPDGSGTLLVTTSLADVEATVDRLVTIDVIVGTIVLAGLALAGYSVVRTAMRPLTEIEATAAAIARGDMARRIADEDPRTEVGRLGAALNSMLNQIESAFRAREASETTARGSEERMRRFVADASHELRTPLTSIRGFAELHRQGAVTEPDEVRRLLGRIEGDATRMGLLVDDLLLLARLDQQRPVERSPVDLVAVARDAVEAARPLAPVRVVTLVVNGTPEQPGAGPDGVIVLGDDARLRQVVTNLLDNARAHTPAGTPVTVRVARTTRDGRVVAQLEVSDRGPGLTAEQAERVFERFYRIDTARNRAAGGTGLGLSIVAAITATHRGTVEVDSRPGEGATFRVVLPLAGDGDRA